MKRYLLFGDTHFATKPVAKERVKIFDYVADIMRERKVDACIHTGDVCDNKDCHPAELVYPVVNGFKRLSEIAPVFIIQGNHDHAFNDANISRGFFSFLTNLPNVTYIHTPTSIDGNVAVYPHNTFDNDSFGAADKARVVITHECFLGATSNMGVALQHGEDLKKLYERGLPGASFFSGDIHKPQFVDKLYYVGAPYQTTFGDDYEGQVVLVEVDGDNVKTETISMEGKFPRLLRRRVDVGKLKEAKDVEAITDGASQDFYSIDIMFSGDDVGKVSDARRLITDYFGDYGLQLHAVASVNIEAEALTAKDGDDKNPDGEEFSLREDGVEPIAIYEAFCDKRNIRGDVREWGRARVRQL